MNRSGRFTLTLMVFGFVLLAFGIKTQGQTAEFTYRGTLDHSKLADASYDFHFTLFDAPSGGANFGVRSRPDIYVNAVWDYTVSLDFGTAAFDGSARYLEIEIRPAGTPDAFTLLSPRALVTSAPYAIRSLSAGNSDVATNATQLGGLTANQYVQTTDARLSDQRNPLPNSSNYIQNTTNQQASSNFNISGTGKANIFDAATQYNIAGSRVLSIGDLSIGDFGSTFLGIRTGTGTTGPGNTFVGYQAGQYATGWYNSFFGPHAGANTTYGYNSFFGYSAGVNNTSGENNTAVGFFAGPASGNLNNATAIGAYASVTQSNSLVLGSSDGVHDTKVGIGTTAPFFKLDIIDPLNAGLRVQTNTAGGAVASFGGNGEFQIDASGIVGGRFVIKENGKVGIGNPNPNDKLNVNGNISLLLGSGGVSPVCQNNLAQLSTCASSLRYKTNVNSFISGLSLLNRLRPVSFNWKANNLSDFGLVAEEVEQVEPLLVTHNEKGEVEGVKYDRLGVVLINAVKEQQAQIEDQRTLIQSQQELLETQQLQIKRQQKQFEALKRVVCTMNASADICKAKE